MSRIKVFFKNTIKKNYQKFRAVSISILFILMCTLIVCLVLTNKPTQEKAKIKTLTIALVNEDIPSKFNNQNYNFGKNFVDLVSNDNKYNWQVVSRSVAEKAYTDKSIDAVIYLPQSFSSDLVTLQDIDPTQAKVDYKVQSQEDELSEKMLQEKITSVLYSFNQNVVKMYYSSVAGNISEAESQMNKTVGKQDTLVTDLSVKVKSPFENSLPNYKDFISGASSLNKMNEGNVSTQKNFTDGTKNLMKQTSDNFSSQLPNITNYFDTQKKIAAANVENANEGISNQSESDQTFYFNQFDELNTNTLNGLDAFYKKNSAGNETGELAELQKNVREYNTLIDDTRSNIIDQITTLTDKRDELLKLENELYAQFFSQSPNVTTDTFENYSDTENIENARKALSAKLHTSLSKTDNLSDTGYLAILNDLISQISLSTSDYKLDELEANGTIDSETRTKLEERLQLIGQYADAFELSGGSLTLDEIPTNEVIDQTLTRNVQISVPSGAEYHSSSFPAEVTITPNTENGLTINADNSITLENPLQMNSKESKNPGDPIVFEFQLSLELSDKTAYQFETTWTNKEDGRTLSTTLDTFALMPRESMTNYNQYIEENFQCMLGLFEKIDRISSIIAILYADPNEDYKSLLSATTQEDFNNKSEKSIFNMYGNLDLSKLSERLSDQDVQEYLNMGQGNLKKVVETIKELNGSITHLKNDETLLKNNLPEAYFVDNLSALNNWYNQTSSKVEEVYSKWRQQDPTTLEIKEWGNSSNSKPELYTATGNSLYDQIKSLLSATEKSTMTISDNSMAVQDNSPQFELLVEQATNAQREAQILLKNTNSLVSTGNQGVAESQEFYQEFSKTLANTRIKGANTQKIYDFFASPIKSSNVTPKQNKLLETKKSFDSRWVIIFIVGIIAGVIIGILGQSGLIRLRK